MKRYVYIYNFNFPQNIIVNPSPNIPIVIYIENNGNWNQSLLEDGRYEYSIRFSVFYYQNDDKIKECCEPNKYFVIIVNDGRNKPRFKP